MQNFVNRNVTPTASLVSQVEAAAMRSRVDKSSLKQQEPQSTNMWDTDVGSVADTTTASFGQSLRRENYPREEYQEDSDEDSESKSDGEEETDEDHTQREIASPLAAKRASINTATDVDQHKSMVPPLHQAPRHQNIPIGSHERNPLPTSFPKAKAQTHDKGPDSKRLAVNQPPRRTKSSHPILVRSFSPPKEKSGRDPAISAIPTSGQRDPANLNRANRQRSGSVFAGSELGSEQTKETTSAEAAIQQEVDLDYSPEDLAGMRWEDLASEPFDRNPRIEGPLLPENIRSESLAVKLKHIFESDPGDSSLLKSFYGSLTIEEYEQCGDVLLDQFSEVVQKFKELRQEKRAAAKQFENEVAARQEAVKERCELLEKDLSRLKRQGSDVVKGTP